MKNDTTENTKDTTTTKKTKETTTTENTKETTHNGGNVTITYA